MNQYINGVYYTAMQCTNCATPFAVTVDFATYQKETGGYIHCPNGHKQGCCKDGKPVRKRATGNAALLISHRKEQNLSQTDVAVLIGTSPATVSRYERKNLKKGHAGYKKITAWLKAQ